MEKKIIITGTPKAIGNIIRENRIREKRGEVTFQETPDAKQPETTENKPGKRTNNKEARTC